jgi:hypothetical protein
VCQASPALHQHEHVTLGSRSATTPTKVQTVLCQQHDVATSQGMLNLEQQLMTNFTRTTYSPSDH